MVLIVIIRVAIFMSAPVYGGAMDGAHKKMDRQQQEHPPMGSKCHIKCNIRYNECDPGRPTVAEAVQGRPDGIVATESRFGLLIVQEVVHIDVLGLNRHRPHVFEKMWGMGVLLGIAIRVMHPVKDRIGAGIQKGRSLRDKGEEVEESFPKSIHPKHLVGGIAMQKERLRK